MRVEISNEITVYDPTPELTQWCKKNLIVDNPEWEKKFRMKLWLGDTPEKLWLYKIDAGALVLPFGVFKTIYPMISGAKMTVDFPDTRQIDFKSTIELFDYQEPAVNALYAAGMGILESKAGSGKTQMGLALAAKLGCKTLWLTHTHDLLDQSRKRAAEYMDDSLFGEITAGKVNIGKGITFATVQTLVKQDLTKFRDTWDCVIVDECHRVAGTPTNFNQFGRVLSSLACRHKYGLSATVHRADGLTKCIFMYLGNIAYSVPDEAVADKVMTVKIQRQDTGTMIHPSCLDTDGTLIYTKLINYLAGNTRRNFRISNDLVENADHYNLILSDRLEHLRWLKDSMPDELQDQCVMIDGSMTTKKAKAEREQAIEDMRSGKKRYLFASYRLAKEGLDIPRLDRLYLTTPQKDFAVIVQSVGRIARTFEGKADPICYDYVDDIDYLVNAYKQRCRHYRKSGCDVEK
jgi:superfamily II DNA or RNA helicase